MRTAPMLRRPHPKRAACPVASQAHPLARRFFEILDEQGVALTDIAERAGLGVATLVKWKYRHAPTVISLEAALNALGYELRVVERSNRGGAQTPAAPPKLVVDNNARSGR